MAIKSALLSVSIAACALGMASPASASCGGIGNCDTGVHFQGGYATDFGPVTVQSKTPYDYMNSINYTRSPHVSITRIHGMGQTVGLSDAPSGFSDGCHPTSTTYCREHNPVAQPLPVPQLDVQMFPQAPAVQAPVFQAPVQQNRVVAVGGGYDASKFTPRIYGDLSVTPGIAHVPTSFVDRDPQRAQAVLDQVAPGSVTPALSGLPIRGHMGPQMMGRPVMAAPMMPAPMMHGPVMQRPMMSAPVMRAPVMQAQMAAPIAAPGIALGSNFQPPVAGAPRAQGDGTYASTVASDGSFWEKVSGPTMMGSTVATSVICKRTLPKQVVNPQVGVPYPVPVPVPGPVVDVCQPGPHSHPAAQGHHGMPKLAGGRY